MKVFIIADTHCGHENIIKYCNRPFQSVEEMNRVILNNWNNTVSKHDLVIHLGDLYLGKKADAREFLKKLNGRKILIMGNHDHWSEAFYRECGFETVSRFPIVYNNFFLMSHAPLQLSETTPYFNCYGHVHNDEKYQDTATSQCFSVERINYTPYLLFDTEASREENDEYNTNNT